MIVPVALVAAFLVYKTIAHFRPKETHLSIHAAQKFAISPTRTPNLYL